MSKKIRLGWIMEDPHKKLRKLPEKPQKPAEEPQKKPTNIRYYRGKYEVEPLKKTSEGVICKALTPFTSGKLTVKLNAEFLAKPRFLWKRTRKDVNENG